MEEDIKILENIKEYMQNQINKGYHKFIFNDLGGDEKCIDVINAIENLIQRFKVVKAEYKREQYRNELLEETININYIPKSKIKEIIDNSTYPDIAIEKIMKLLGEI